VTPAPPGMSTDPTGALGNLTDELTRQGNWERRHSETCARLDGHAAPDLHRDPDRQPRNPAQC
jgi:hypothetical protein